MTEFWLFLIAGVIAVAAATLMLLSSNAVHSALFLVVTMVAVAFLFLLLNAPFLAMIQISVYAGAIMVLFLFVIMLLGSEKLDEGEGAPPRRRFAWFIPLAITLSLSLLLAIGLTISASGATPSSLQSTPPENARVRVLHAVGGAGPANVTIEGETAAEPLAFREASDYFEVPPGEIDLGLLLEDGTAVSATLDIVAGSAGTLIGYRGAEGGVTLTFAAESLETVDEARSGRVVFFNAHADVATASLVDLGSEFYDDDTTVIAENVAFGQASAPIAVGEGDVSWVVVDGSTPESQVAALPLFEVGRNTSELVVLVDELVMDGSPRGIARPAAVLLEAAARPSFGGPQAIGYLLFIDYLLPFQLLALLLLAAMVGVIALTHRQIVPSAQRLGVRRRVSRPLVNVIAAQVGHDVTEADSTNADEQPQAAGD